MQQEYIDDFDNKARTWDENPMHVERAIAIAAKIREHIDIKSGTTAFEFGCGTGLLSFNLLPLLKTITLADSSDGMIMVLKDKIEKLQIKNMQVIKTGLIKDTVPQNKFDLIYTSLTIHHIEDIAAILSVFYTMLHTYGWLAIADLDKEDGSFHGEGFTGHNGFDRDAMKVIFESIGFRNIRSETCYGFKRNDESGEERSYTVFLMVGEKC
jgi:ubiquinone/menaquinone biosynthesis C-methylase UbiE